MGRIAYGPSAPVSPVTKREKRILKTFLKFIEVKGRITSGLRPAPTAKFTKYRKTRDFLRVGEPRVRSSPVKEKTVF